MKTKINLGRFVAVAAILLVCPALLIADTMIRQTEHMDAMEMMGQKQPARTDTTVAWITDNMTRVDRSDTVSFIIHMDKALAYVINHSAKNYGELSLKPAEDKDGKYPGADTDNPMTQMMNVKGTVTPTDETKKIKDWNCRKFNVDLNLGMVTMKQEIWATEDIKVDYAMYHQASNAMMSQFKGYDDLMKEMKKLKGLPILTIVNVNIMGTEMKRTMEVFEIKDATPPGGYDVPKDYKKTELQSPMPTGP